MRAALVGAPLVLLALTLLCGSFSTAVQVLFWSVVCTVGIGSLFWLGLAFLVGSVLELIVQELRRGARTATASTATASAGAAKEGTDATAVPSPQLSSRPLGDYVQRRLQAGSDRDHLRSDLQRAGWSDADIAAALNAAAPSPAGPSR